MPPPDPSLVDTLIGSWPHQTHVYTTQHDIAYCLQMGATIHGCSDGSVSSDQLTGTYGWVLVARLHSVQHVLAVGSGRCDTADNPAIGALDSTRMESIGIVAGLRAWARHEECADTPIRWICDNSGAVSTYGSHRGLDMRRWQKLENRDIWGYLKTWHHKPLRRRTTVAWHRGHPERRMKSDRYSPDDWLNVWADEIAGHSYSRPSNTCKPWLLANAHPIVVCYDEHVLTGSVPTTISKYIGRANGMTYSTTHSHITDLTKIDLLRLDRTEAKLKSPFHRLAQTRRVWELYPTAARIHKLTPDKQPLCHCGKEWETHHHAIHTCTHTESIVARQLAQCNLAELWEAYFPKDNQTKWADFWSNLFHISDRGITSHWSEVHTTGPLSIQDYPPWFTRWIDRLDVTVQDVRITRTQVSLGSTTLLERSVCTGPKCYYQCYVSRWHQSRGLPHCHLPLHSSVPY